MKSSLSVSRDLSTALTPVWPCPCVVLRHHTSNQTFPRICRDAEQPALTHHSAGQRVKAKEGPSNGKGIATEESAPGAHR